MDFDPSCHSRQFDRDLAAGWSVLQVDGAPMGRDDGANDRQAEAVSRSRAGGASPVAAPTGGERSLQGFRAPSETCTRTVPSAPLTVTIASVPGRV